MFCTKFSIFINKSIKFVRILNLNPIVINNKTWNQNQLFDEIRFLGSISNAIKSNNFNEIKKASLKSSAKTIKSEKQPVNDIVKKIVKVKDIEKKAPRSSNKSNKHKEKTKPIQSKVDANTKALKKKENKSTTEQTQPYEENPLENIFKTIKKRESDEKSIENISQPKTNLLQISDATHVGFSFNGQAVSVYTDGACSKNGKIGASAGIGVYFGENHPLNLSQKLNGTVQTNNKAEIMAAVRAINLAIEYNAGELTIYTDSKYLVKCIKWISLWKINGWKTIRKSDVKNLEDLKRLDQLCSQIKIKWKYVPGHKGVLGNEEADRLAKDAIILEKIEKLKTKSKISN